MQELIMTTKVICCNRDELYQAVTARVAVLLKDAVDNNAKAGFIVPGGTTPAPIFERLSTLPLAWDKISVSASDERWIDVDSESSNEYLIKHSLLINKAEAATYVGLKNDADTATAGQKKTERNLKNLALPATVTLLGMGPDGHVASLFPGCPQIDDALDLNQKKTCIAIDARGCTVAGEYTERMSLTLSALINSDLIILLITGQEKLDVINQAIREKMNSSLPVAKILSQGKTPVEVYWAK
ncbi:MAG: 6-phosphogluconolactonase [Gammaproteobacteria bacterium]|nr:MAG: 6-phosphogluconolactonase [Gammaproteobacteria bacterium]